MKIFIAGPRAINKLDDKIILKLDNIHKKNYDVLIGDADGVDRLVQNYFSNKSYSNVTIFASNGIARNNLGNWEIANIKVDKNIKGFEFYVKKDIEMAKKSDIGFMIWNGKSKGTFNNMINLLNLNKEVVLYYTVLEKFYHFSKFDDLLKFVHNYVQVTPSLTKLLPQVDDNKYVQSCLF